MKKQYLIYVVLSIIPLVIGCASGSPKPSEMTTEAPDFVHNPPSQEEAIFGIGSAKAPSIPDALRVAENRARQSLALQLHTNVQAMITTYAKSKGIRNGGLAFAEYIKQQLPPTELTEAVTVRQVGTSEGTCWTLISYNKAAAAKTIARIITRETDQYPEFKTMDALELMKQQLGQITTKPELVRQ